MPHYSVKRKAKAGVNCNVGVSSSWDSINSSTTRTKSGLCEAMPRERFARRWASLPSQWDGEWVMLEL